MKKSLVIVSAVIIMSVIIVVVALEKYKKTPQDRYREHINSSDTVISDNNSETSEDVINIVTNQTGTVEYELLSYFIVDDKDIENTNKLSEESFIEGSFPDPNTTVEYIDYAAMREDYPNVKEYFESNGQKGMTSAEYQEFLTQHLAEYTTCKHPETKFLFIRCRIKNNSSNQVNEIINDVRIYAMSEGRVIDIEEINSYFDHSQHTEGEDRIHNYFHYTFEPGEMIECVIGCKLTDDRIDFSKNPSYYVGFEPIGLQDPYQFDPSIDSGFVSICELSKEL